MHLPDFCWYRLDTGAGLLWHGLFLLLHLHLQLSNPMADAETFTALRSTMQMHTQV